MSKINSFKALLALVLTGLTLLFGNLTIPLAFLVAGMIIDYLTAIAAAENRGQEVYSRIGIEGISKKFFMLALVFVCGIFEALIVIASGSLRWGITIQVPLAILMCIWLSLNEFISIFENLQDCGVRLPKKLIPFAKNLHSKIDKEFPTDKEEDNAKTDSSDQ